MTGIFGRGAEWGGSKWRRRTPAHRVATHYVCESCGHTVPVTGDPPGVGIRGYRAGDMGRCGACDGGFYLTQRIGDDK